VIAAIVARIVEFARRRAILVIGACLVLAMAAAALHR
jgi:hypothetical protein